MAWAARSAWLQDGVAQLLLQYGAVCVGATPTPACLSAVLPVETGTGSDMGGTDSYVGRLRRGCRRRRRPKRRARLGQTQVPQLAPPRECLALLQLLESPHSLMRGQQRLRSGDPAAAWFS